MMRTLTERDILALERLDTHRGISEQEIAEELLRRDITPSMRRALRERLSDLVLRGELTRTPGIASVPAYYRRPAHRAVVR